MVYLLLVIIVLLGYIAFFTPEKRERRAIRRVQKVFNAPLPAPKEFDINDPRNKTHPEEIVMYRNSPRFRELAVLSYEMEHRSLRGLTEKGISKKDESA